MNILRSHANDFYQTFSYGVICVVCCLFGLALSPASAASPLISEPNFSVLSTKNGLSQDTVNAMAFDQDGFLWIATDGGLNRFDGYRLSPIKGPNDELNELAIYAIFFDSQQRLWIGTAGSGVYRFDLATNSLNRVVSIPLNDHPTLNQFAGNFVEDSDGNILISMNESVLRYSPLTETYTSIYSLSAQEIQNGHSIRFVKQVDDIVFVAHTNGFSAIDLAAPARKNIDYLGKIPANIDNMNAKFLLADEQNRFFIGTVQGLYQFELDKLIGFVKGVNPQPLATALDTQRNIWSIKRADDHKLLAGSDIGLLCFELQTNTVSHLLEPVSGAQELSQKDILALVEDKAGNYWFGTKFGGALYWSRASIKFETFFNSRLRPEHRPLTHNTVWSIAPASEDELWVGTDNGLNRLNISSGQSQKFLYNEENKNAFTESTIEGIFPDKEGNLWLQTALGLRYFSPDKGIFIDAPKLSDVASAVLMEPVFGSKVDHSGNLWFNNGQAFYRLDVSSGRLDQIVGHDRTFSAERGGIFLGPLYKHSDDMLVGTHNSLWLVDSQTRRAKHLFTVPERFWHRRIVPTSWVVDNNNVLWLAYTSLGIFGLDATTFEQRYFFNTSNILNTNTVYGLTVDNEQNLWFSSHNGIHRYSPSTQSVSHYQYGQELTTAEFNQGANTKMANGKIAYGSPKGLILFDPASIPPSNEKAGQLAITAVDLSSRKLALPSINLNGHTIALAHDDVGLTINFSNMSYNSAQSSKYYYRLLEGNHVVVQASTRLPKVTFPTLSPGKYQFEVSTDTHGERDDVKPTGLTIMVQYAPWWSPLTISLYAVILLAAFISWQYLRKQQKQRLDDEKRKVRLFGNAFSHTRDWVIIFNDKFMPVAANDAFEQTFGINPQHSLPNQLKIVNDLQPELQEQILELMTSLKPGSYAKQEMQIINNFGKIRDVIMNVTAICDDKFAATIDYFLFVITDITEQKNAERQLIKVANYDNLTGLVNRSLFMDRLEHATTRARQKSETHAILFIDLDRFKSVNDSLGHDYGDKLLQNIAKRMLNITGKNDTVARMGGDEFVILMEDIEQPEHLIDFINLLIDNLQSPITIDNEVLRVSCSVGVSLYPNDSIHAHELLKQADVAMYSAKQDNLVGFKYFTEELNYKAQQRLLLENQIKKAHQEQGFENYYQPIVDIQQGKVAGFELLLRCTVDGQRLSPCHFIPVAEELRLLIDMTQNAIERGLKDLQTWYKQGFEGYLSVNLSALHFKTNFDISSLKNLLESFDLPVSALRFEITESALMENTEQALQKFSSLQAAGFMLALDDFGTGYSSLSYLKKFPLQVLKIDKSFVDDIGKDTDSDAIVLTTLGMAKNLNMICVAEGIEHAHQVNFFRQHGCRYIQGYFYSKPVNRQGVKSLLHKRWSTD